MAAKRSRRKKSEIGPSEFVRRAQIRMAELREIATEANDTPDRLEALREMTALHRVVEQQRKEAERLEAALRLEQEAEAARAQARAEQIARLEKEYGSHRENPFGAEETFRMEAEIERETKAFHSALLNDLDATSPGDKDSEGSTKGKKNGDENEEDDRINWKALANPPKKTKSGSFLGLGKISLPTGAAVVIVLLLIIILLHLVVIPIEPFNKTRWQLMGSVLKGDVTVDHAA
jgi:hypothetical protein